MQAKILKVRPVVVTSDVVSINGSSQSSSSTVHKGFMKLPTINLSNFNGNPKEWLNFRDFFINFIHENEPPHKLHYLRASLTGKVAETIKSLAISSANYQIAWDSVNDRFNNSRILVHNHIKALFNTEVIAKESSAKPRSSHTREFENKNDSDKFPPYEELISFMEKKQSIKEIKNRTQSALPLTVHSCEKFKQFGLKERSEKAKELKVCYNCLAKGHFTCKCKSRFNYQRCKSRHHTLFHQVASVSSTEAEQATVNLSAFGSNQTIVLIATALVRILDSDGNSHPASALLDSGRMFNFISESSCKRLQLTRFPVDLQFREINSTATSIESRCNVEVISSNSRFQMKSSCLVIPHITVNIPEAKVKSIFYSEPIAFGKSCALASGRWVLKNPYCRKLDSDGLLMETFNPCFVLSLDSLVIIPKRYKSLNSLAILGRSKKHEQLLHAGPQLLLASVCEVFGPLEVEASSVNDA
ncbi:hypothetical protein ILUMI_22465 [Ignelater luminosus]|uniref:CCHC-type domain-containing protein n=1 Tax=Ignelater luminosus TaxID=2038154 RepID=A0A8K0CA44_IGNLU|nr:hypothetical protein ILUMI_22465 [Ignelater luminosus]